MICVPPSRLPAQLAWNQGWTKASCLTWLTVPRAGDVPLAGLADTFAGWLLDQHRRPVSEWLAVCRYRVAVTFDAVGTDIYGGIEYRHPGAGSDCYEGDTWLTVVSLRPLYDQADYAAFGCLFGIRNYAGYTPLAAGRGLPADLSSGLRAELEAPVAAGHMDGATWVSWAELAALDPSAIPGHFIGRLTWSARSQPWLLHEQLVPAQWPAEVRGRTGDPPAGWKPDTERMEWETGSLTISYQTLSAGTVLGPGTHWPHVFAVMSALAGRFGDDGVRLVAAFD